jgi:ADP-dependent NAD(P)H-hydrate dehydratase
MERLESLPRLSPRDPSSHKGDFGRVLIAAGSPGMPGAAVLASRGALRAGAGLVSAAVPGSISTVLGAACPEATQVLLPEPADASRERLRDTLTAERMARFDVVAAGPGLGTGDAARVLLELLLEWNRGPLLLDADALNIVAAFPTLAADRLPGRVWTPHPGELQRLSGELPRTDSERLEAARRFAGRRGGVLVLKGPHTLVFEEGRYFVNQTGNPGMAKGGSGDVLTGIIAALMAQGLAPFEAACLGVHVHGLAGDIAAAELGEVSILASDIVERLPVAFVRLVRQGPWSAR